jgi:hypothetical protein
MELVRRAKVLRLCKEILGSEARAADMEDLILALEDQGSHIDALLKQEVALKMALFPEENLLPFKKPPSRLPLSGKLKVFEKRFVVSTPCLIEGSSPLERKKLAFEIHSRSRKSVFIDVESMDGFWTEDVLGLEDSTFFLPEITRLNEEEQQALLEILSRPESPLVISATARPFAELKDLRALSPELLQKISQAHFRLQRPLKEYLEMGFFKLFLESLS